MMTSIEYSEERNIPFMIWNRAFHIWSALSLCCSLILSGCASNTNPVIEESEDKYEDHSFIPAVVSRVTDGDTLKVTLEDGTEETVRLLLVDTPETKHPSKPVEPFGPEASEFAEEMLEGKEVELELEVAERDKYGRLLAYVYVDGRMFNEMLLELGLARVAYVFPPNVKYVDQFREIQDIARGKAMGIWSVENYAKEDGPQTRYKNCAEVREAGKAPLVKSDPGYSLELDGDKDGVACEGK
jgi:micrococcal nuclease